MNSMQGATGYKGPAGNYPDRAAGKNYFSGDKIPKGYKTAQLQNFTPEAMDLYNSLFGHLGPNSYLSRLAGGDEEAFREAEAPAWRNFQQAQGQLGSRFSQLAPGAMSAQRGSGFQNEANQQSSDFAMNLAAQRQQLSRQALHDLFDLSNTLLGQKPYERSLVEKEKPFWQQLALSAAPGVVQGATHAATAGLF